MPAITNHPYLPQPESDILKVWRYMSFTKFLDILSNQRLFLNRADNFEDIWEGIISQATFNIKSNNLILASFQTDKQETIKQNNFLRNWTYINCWHLNEYESAAMWDLYSDTKEAIAIETTYKDLVNCLPSDTLVASVKYIDYDKTMMPVENQLTPFIYKRTSFSHEKEIRIIKQDERRIVTEDDSKFLKRKNSECDDNNDLKGIFINNINLKQLVKTLYVSPKASVSFFKLVKKVVNEDYKLDIEIKQSDLYKDPIY